MSDLIQDLHSQIAASRAECERLRALLLEARETMLAPRAAYEPLIDKIDAALGKKETGDE